MKTLLIIDMQNDFMPNGSLAVPKSDEIIPLINQLIPHFDVVIATQDWHPSHHASFASTHGMTPGKTIQVGNVVQALWPDHCIQHTSGADFAKGLNLKPINQVIRKGMDPKIDSYSAFFDNAKIHSTGLKEYLFQRKLKDLYFVGVATDYCVLYSVLDAVELGFSATVIIDACRSVHLHPNDELHAIQKMKEKGAKISYSSNFL